MRLLPIALAYFLEVARTSSVAPSAISRQVAKLEAVSRCRCSSGIRAAARPPSAQRGPNRPFWSTNSAPAADCTPGP
ncbi:LysR family transcriptional regulator [Amycolatopsis sp. cmx-4-54]|uniref:helix-turn-helix domain-containing protein n=1 Tax=Amycolatopsis sp. cmx-4-54 TaxID=2790936 RepID=UPI003978531E